MNMSKELGCEALDARIAGHCSRESVPTIEVEIAHALFLSCCFGCLALSRSPFAPKGGVGRRFVSKVESVDSADALALYAE